MHIRRFHRLTALAILGLVAAISFTACGGSSSKHGAGGSSEGASYSTETYTSLPDLSKASDAVVIGTVLDDGVKSVDHGFATPVEGAPDPSFAVVVYRFAVESTIASNAALPQVLSVVIPADAYGEGGISQLAEGQHLVLFLQRYAKTDVDGLTEAWAPMSYDNGEFEIRGDSVVARSMNLRSITAASGAAAAATAASDELTTNVASLTKAVRSSGLATPYQYPVTTGP